MRFAARYVAYADSCAIAGSMNGIGYDDGSVCNDVWPPITDITIYLAGATAQGSPRKCLALLAKFKAK